MYEQAQSRVSTFRKFLGYGSLISGILAGLSAFLLVPDKIGLCSILDRECQNTYRNIGEILLVIFLGIFIIGIISFTLSRKDSKGLRIFSLVVAIIGTIVYFTASTYSDVWNPSTRELLGYPITIIYGATILTYAIKELFLNFLTRINYWKLIPGLVLLTLIVWYLIGTWL